MSHIKDNAPVQKAEETVDVADTQDDSTTDQNGNTHVALKEFDPTTIKLDSFAIVIGQRRYGKTIWVRWMLSYLFEYFPAGGYVFTRSKQNLFWSQHFPNSHIYNGLGKDQEEVFLKIMETQRIKHKLMLETGDFSICPYIFLILDDVIADQGAVRFNKVLNEMAFTGRHYNVFVIITTQDVKGLPPMFHQNAGTFFTSSSAHSLLSFALVR